jgi:hypothetical protein
MTIPWSWCDVCELFKTEGDITCTCDDEYLADCTKCGEEFNTAEEWKWYAQKFEKMCDACFAIEVQKEQYDAKEISKEALE